METTVQPQLGKRGEKCGRNGPAGTEVRAAGGIQQQLPVTLLVEAHGGADCPPAACRHHTEQSLLRGVGDAAHG